MHISDISVENFRLFKKLSLTLNPGLNVVVGENNSGKTALLDAIRLTLDTNSAEWTRISENDFNASSGSFSIKLKFENITADQAQVFVEHLTHEEVEGGARKSVLYINLVANLTDNINRGHRYIKTEIRSGENAEGPLVEREVRDYLSATYLKPLRDAEAELSAGRSSRLAQILASSKGLKEEENFKKLLTDFIEASQKVKENPGVAASRESIDGHFKNLTFQSDEEKFNIAVQILGGKEFDHMSTSERLRSFQEILERLSLTLHEQMPLQGLGYNNILFMATELILLEQEEGQFPLLLIEEPEAHLHPQLQMKFLKFIRHEYSNEENPKIQTILSTHSPNLTSKAPLESIILMKDGAAFPMRKGETKLHDDDYIFLEKFLDITKSNLFFAKGLLVVEGDAENILLPTIAELLGRPLEGYGVSVVNVGSTAYSRYAKIFMREDADCEPDKWLPVPVACLRDLDLWPEKADEDVFDGGFKEVKDGNKHMWLPRLYLGDNIGTEPEHKKRRLEKLAVSKNKYVEVTLCTQKTKVFVSDKWTFEYCLSHSNLAPLVYEAIVGNQDGFENLSVDREERAIQLYAMIDKSDAKTSVAYNLIPILQRDYGGDGKKENLKQHLPAYILDALEYVTEHWPANLDIEEAEEQVVVNANNEQPDE